MTVLNIFVLDSEYQKVYSTSPLINPCVYAFVTKAALRPQCFINDTHYYYIKKKDERISCFVANDAYLNQGKINLLFQKIFSVKNEKELKALQKNSSLTTFGFFAFHTKMELTPSKLAPLTRTGIR